MFTTTHNDNTNDFETEMVECDSCGNVWDGNAQCTCLMLGPIDEESDNEEEMDNSSDTMSTGSDGSDMLVEFEETGHIPMEMTRDNIQKMLIIARSQTEPAELPDWMEEGSDIITGDFMDGAFIQERRYSPTEDWVLQRCPMLTDEECDDFYNKMALSLISRMVTFTIEDIVDGINIKRMRDYDTARVNQLHWPAWVNANPATLQLAVFTERD
jgi:hypothetical protein